MELIINRTESDVLARNAKGCYGYEDLNRVESAVAELVELGRQLGISLHLTVNTSWGQPGIFPAGFPTRTEMERYLDNVRQIRSGYGLSAPLPSSMRRLTHTGANNIEKALSAAYQRAERTIPNFLFSGEVFAGEG